MNDSPSEICIPATSEPLDIASLFGNHHPIEVDVGSGKGRFLLARAAAHPGVNFIGIERQHRRVAKVASKTARANLTNIRLLHAEIRFALEMRLTDAAVQAFYIFFPDPWPKRRHHPRRLINGDFLKLLHRKLAPGGDIHFATDHHDYFETVSELFAETSLFTPCEPFMPIPSEQTDFELLFAAKGKSANRCSFRKPLM